MARLRKKTRSGKVRLKQSKPRGAKTKGGKTKVSTGRRSVKRIVSQKKISGKTLKPKKSRMSAKKSVSKTTSGSAKTASVKPRRKTGSGPLTDAKRIAELRAMLEARRAEILEEIKQARASGTQSNQATYAEVGDLVTASVEKERAFEYSEAGINALKEIDLALEKLEQGTYGICELCGKPISVARLKIMPSATLCLECKTREEQMGSAASRPERHMEIYPMEDEEDIDQ